MFEKAKGLKISKTILQKKIELGNVFNSGKNVLSQPLPCKKNCCEICNNFFSTNIFFYCDCFVLNIKLKIYEDSYF